MATGTIQKVIPDSDDGYCKLPDGTLICYGKAGGYSGEARKDLTVTLPVAFRDAEYRALAGGAWFSDAISYEVTCTVKIVDKQTISIHVRNPTSNYTNAVCWLAIGRWK